MIRLGDRVSWLITIAGAIGCGVIVFMFTLNILQNTQRINDTNHRIDNLRHDWAEVRSTVDSINADRNKRTEILRRIDEHLSYIDSRLDALEPRVRR